MYIFTKKQLASGASRRNASTYAAYAKTQLYRDASRGNYLTRLFFAAS